MRHTLPPDPQRPAPELHIWPTLKALFPYLWQFKGRVSLAMACLLGAKLANVAVPIVFKHIIDALTGPRSLLALPLVLLLLYGLLRFGTSLFTELREMLFARVTQRVVRHVALQVFGHLHSLSLRFHLDRQTGGVSRDIERGTRSISSLISYTLYSILPTLVELALVLGILIARYDPAFAVITGISLVTYILYTVWLSNRRIAIRRAVNETDSRANTRAVDSLLNYETVKYFNNEDFEARRYDTDLAQWEDATTRSQISLSLLNLGQQAIIALGITAMMWRATLGVLDGSMTVGDLVLVNAFLMQLYMPLNFLGVVYREIRQALTDIERMFALLNEHQEIGDRPNAQVLNRGPAEICFHQVDFGYQPTRSILQGVSFTIPAGKTLAVVGESGAGKSTLARLLYRFYDVTGGAITINGTDLRDLTQHSLRSAIAIVPQDTVLFNNSIFYNIQYGRPGASREEVIKAAEAAQLSAFIASLPEGWDTPVGERGLKLSGGEKQRVAIARALLKNPPILIFDEATSALDSATEQAIQGQLTEAARGRTTLIIAHRLSTIREADRILVLKAGQVVESGSHEELLAARGNYYTMWQLQQAADQGEEDLQ